MSTDREAVEMPVEHRWDEATRTLHTRLRGRVTRDEMLRNGAEVAKDPRIVAPFQEIVDLREVESHDLTIEGLRNIVQIDVDSYEKFKGQRQAIVAPAGEMENMALSYATLAKVHGGPATIRIFPTYEEAERWLASPAE